MKNTSWREMTPGQKVHYHTDEGFDTADLLCEVSEKQSDHCILKVLGWFFNGVFAPDKGEPWSLYIDDDTSSACEMWKPAE